MANNENNLDAYNAVEVALGSLGLFLNDMAAVNAIAVLEGTTGGHLNMIDGLNAIDLNAGGTGTHLNTLDALNSIVVLKGGLGGHENDLDAINEWVDFAFTGIFDTVAGAVVGYSIGRRLSSTYSGSLLRVRRQSDNAEQDIGFTERNILDIAALDSFCAGTDGFVAKIYDQSGNGDDMIQATASKQPKIVSSGTTIVDGNGNPIAQFDGSDDGMQAASVAIDTFASIYVVGTFTTAKPMFIEHGPDANTNDGFFFFGTSSGPWQFRRSLANHTCIGVANWMGAALAQVTLTYDGSAAYFKNGSVQDNTTETGTARADTTVTDDLNLLSRDQISTFSDGDFYEMILFDGAHSAADQSTVESNQKTKYSTP